MAEFEKVLYRKQPFPDNYTPDSFLDEVVFNAHVKERCYWTVVTASETVLQQMCTVCIAVGVSFHLYRDSIDFSLMSAICIAVLVTGTPPCSEGDHGWRCRIFVMLCDRWACVGRVTLQSGQTMHTADFWLKNSGGDADFKGLSVGVFFLSPLLQSLTETISTDTVIALICLLLLTHLYFHDYKSKIFRSLSLPFCLCSFVNSVTDKFTGSVSLGCAIFSSVLIASRMHSTLNVVSTVIESQPWQQEF